ncbi:MAG: Cof-type HAD-IIB family hydrolase [Bacteroides sp.]|nr:Cof-type HAD-IIB family hydrolase [Roseburia sp.]MCM1347551.1 Cof-type HAD-IIB family hydrolase [Bacteroides sp.]MCM1420603.1 Cof-type HAD-IIB family hydrolase [Bacteroides sp.]
MKTIKAIFFDIDGTLVSFKTHTIPPSAIQAIHAAREKGVKIFIATGRPMPFIDNLGALEYDGIITVNGALCATSEGKVLYLSPVCAADLARLILYHKANPFPIAFASDKEVFLTGTNSQTDEIFRLLKVRPTDIRPIEHCLDMSVMQIIAFFPEDNEAAIMSDVLKGCTAHRWHPYFADIISEGNSKSSGIDTMLRHYGIPLSEAMAFGDGGNDISMLRHVAHGVAMGNADDKVKAAARYVTASVDDHGVACMLKSFLEL